MDKKLLELRSDLVALIKKTRELEKESFFYLHGFINGLEDCLPSLSETIVLNALRKEEKEKDSANFGKEPV